jgi:DNA-binding NtrC family response regulator
MKRRILIAEDSSNTREHLRTLLEKDDRFQVDVVGDGAAAFDMLCGSSYSILITDLKMPGMDGMRLIEHVRQKQLPVTMIVVTGYGSIDQAVQAMRLGAYDFLTKPVDFDYLSLVIERALRERGLMDELMQLREQIRSQHAYQNMVSKNPRMHAVFELITNVGQTTTTVLIEGETGTGKEQVARAIHLASARQRNGEMVAVNCAALPENLLESELFGHEKGAFTGAVGSRQGRFELANSGTIFLDEVGDIPPAMQAKLLRVLQERRFERVGGTQSIEVDVRVIGATNRSLRRLVRQNKFREDLYYRLNVVKIDVPPLRERLEDVPLLATHFAARYARVGEPPKEIMPEAMERLLAHHWPGNIRELENAIERACVTARGPCIQASDLPAEVTAPPATDNFRALDLDRPLSELLREATQQMEKQYLRKALSKSRGNVGRAAQICGLSRRSISAKLAEYQIDKSEFKQWN